MPPFVPATRRIAKSSMHGMSVSGAFEVARLARSCRGLPPRGYAVSMLISEL
jgi:hypothetical protein